MAQILDLSKRFTQEQIEEAAKNSDQFNELPAGGYVCKVVRAILNDDPNTGKANIELHVDIASGEYAGYFQKLEDRFGFWGLRGWMSFKDSETIKRFQKACIAFCNSNPGLRFNPFANGGADVDSLEGKTIGVVTRKEEYLNSSGDIREKNTVFYFTEVDNIKTGRFRVPKPKLLEKPKFDPGFIPSSSDDADELPFT